jgi:hypothetical protein
MFLPENPFVVDLETISVKQLVKAIIDARGHQSAAHVRTKLNQKLERRTGRRALGGAQDRIMSNGALRAALNGHV